MPRTLPRRVLDVPRLAQPDDTTCGPACLAQVLAFYGHPVAVAELAGRVRRNPDGGTLAVHLARLALELGLQARLYPFGVRVFDPTWWGEPRAALLDHLDRRGAALVAAGVDPAEVETVRAWREVLALGAQVAFREPSPRLLAEIIHHGHPLIVGLSATWLYREARTRPWDNQHDPHAGWPTGHFVTVCGTTEDGRHLHVRDPSEDAPDHLHPAGAGRGSYPVSGERLVHAVLLGDLTRDAVMLELWPDRHAGPRGPSRPGRSPR